MDFSAFDTRKMDEYSKQAKEQWGKTEAYKEFEENSKGRTDKENRDLGERMMMIFTEFGAIRDADPASEDAQALVKKLQDYITEHFYTCTKEILSGLGKMYAGGGSMTENIDKAGGTGTAEFACKAIEIYCRN